MPIILTWVFPAIVGATIAIIVMRRLRSRAGWVQALSILAGFLGVSVYFFLASYTSDIGPFNSVTDRMMYSLLMGALTAAIWGTLSLILAMILVPQRGVRE